MKKILTVFFLIAIDAFARDCPSQNRKFSGQLSGSPNVEAFPGQAIVISNSCVKGRVTLKGNISMLSSSVTGDGYYEGGRGTWMSTVYNAGFLNSDHEGNNSFRGVWTVMANTRNMTIDSGFWCNQFGGCYAVGVGSTAQISEGVTLLGFASVHGLIGPGITVDGTLFDPNANYRGINVSQTGAVLNGSLVRGAVTVGPVTTLDGATIVGKIGQVQVDASTVTGGYIEGYGVVWVSQLTGPSIVSNSFSINRFNGSLSFQANNVTICDSVTGTIENGYNNCFFNELRSSFLGQKIPSYEDLAQRMREAERISLGVAK